MDMHLVFGSTLFPFVPYFSPQILSFDNMSLLNHSREQSRPSYQTLASSNDAVRTGDESFRIVNIYCYAAFHSC
jgi:hypothetical protein